MHQTVGEFVIRYKGMAAAVDEVTVKGHFRTILSEVIMVTQSSSLSTSHGRSAQTPRA